MNTQEAYKQKYDAKLKEADAQIDKLAAQTENAQADAKARFQEVVKTLRTSREEMGREIAKLNKSGADVAKELQSGVEKAWNEFAASLKSAQAKIH